MSLDISMKALLESGVHFGHRTNRWNPKMKPYIFTERNGIHIIDLQQTVQHLQSSYNLIRDTVANGGTVLFVGTKRQAQNRSRWKPNACGMPYVTERWLPGTRPLVHHFRPSWSCASGEDVRNGRHRTLVKKEQLMVDREIKRLLKHLSGIRHMNGLPDLVFIVDVVREITAVHEANLKEVPIVALVDTNCDPEDIDYVIPSNDDAIRAIKLIVAKIADAVIEGMSMRKEEDLVEKKPFDAIGEDEGRQRVRARIQLEDEENEEELLGAATLQKLADSRREDEEPAAEAEAVDAEPAKKPVKDTVVEVDEESEDDFEDEDLEDEEE